MGQGNKSRVNGVGVLLWGTFGRGYPSPHPKNKVLYPQKTMSRPTDEKKERTIKIRISDDLYQRIKGGNMSESIRNALECSLVPTKNPKEDSFVPTLLPANKANITSTNFVPTLSEEESITLKDIESMVKCTGGTLKEFLDDLDLKLTMETLPLKEGVIDLDRLETDMELEGILKSLEEACEEKGVSMIEVLKRTIQGVFNG